MPGMDKATGRVVALIVLLIVVAAALRGYLPAQAHSTHSEPGGGRAATTFVITALAGTLTLLAVAIVARLRDPRAAAPRMGDPGELLGTGRGRPSWRVVLIGLAVIVAWLLLTALVVQLWVPHQIASSTPTSAPGAPPPAQTSAPAPRDHPRHDTGDMVGILLACTIPMLLLIVAGSLILKRRGLRAAAPVLAAATPFDDEPEPPGPSESLARAAELGLAEMADLSRNPREAIIACYATMERELANVPGAVPQEFDTPTEVQARAVEHHALQADNAVQLVTLFAEARFSPHVMNENHRDVAVRALRLVLDELASRSAA
ncbi:DUF4129 domain-containing protein [Mycobacterium sp. Marseille-P9652]|uniref:DUF4129 domain-containing protein n=1 Tax=Mycobacterium sp. Marseille-P9652 TaxID=2654950 RepID=UPI0012E8918F|nr:DUF4129 domain-containing protein [Mycobacterium sp. Marseille-P9652]